MHKQISLDIIATRPRQFATRVTEALQKKTIEMFGGTRADGVTPGDIISGLPPNLNDPSGDPPTGQPPLALPAKVHFADDDFLRPGDTIFEKLTRSGGVYVASLPVDYYREVWFDGLAARRNDHYTVNSADAVNPVATLNTAVSVTAKYVLAE